MAAGGCEPSPAQAAWQRFGALLAQALSEREVDVTPGARELLDQTVQTGVDRLAGPAIQSAEAMAQADRNLVQLAADLAAEAAERHLTSIDAATASAVLGRCKLWPFCG